MWGTEATVWVDGSPTNNGDLKFDLSPYAGKTITAPARSGHAGSVAR